MLVPVLLVLAGMAAAAWRPMKYAGAANYMRTGRYEEAKAVLSALRYRDSEELAQECEYQIALRMLSEGEYDLAQQRFEALGAYGDAAEQVKECQYRKALALREAGDFDASSAILEGLGEYQDSEEQSLRNDYLKAVADLQAGEYLLALDELETLGEYEDCRELREQVRGELYDLACSHMYRREFPEAISYFKRVEDFRDSRLRIAYCEECMTPHEIDDAARIICEKNEKRQVKSGTLYIKRGYIFVPDEINEDTKSMVYYAGGTGETMLFVEGVYEYFKRFEPNAIMIFFYTSGFDNIEAKCKEGIDMIKQLAEECGIVVHDLVIAGSSNGGYTALHSVARFYTDGNIAPKSCLVLDQGVEWALTGYCLSDEECDSVREAGTEFYLFEQAGVGMDFPPIRNMVEHGDNVTVVECVNDDHNTISVNAYEYGLFSWAFGEYPELDKEEYTLVKLSAD